MRSYFTVTLLGAVVALVACGGGGMNPVKPPAAVVPPQIRAIQAVPPTVPIGGTAQINVDAADPTGGPVTCHFVAQAGTVSLPDSLHAPCTGLYQNDGLPRTSDTITVTATNSANLSTVSSASLALTEPAASPPPSGNPHPAPPPVPTATPQPTVQPPLVTTQPATNITLNSATLNASVDGRGALATYHFEYGQSTTYGSATSEQTVPVGGTAVAVNDNVGSLACGMSYHYRVVGTNAGGQTTGIDRPFTTGACMPTVSVMSSGDCHPTWGGPGCTVTFTATTTNATSVAWSGCASGVGTTSTCTINSITTITAVAVATGPGGTTEVSASAHGVNNAAYVGCGGNPYHFPAPSDQGISLSVDDPDGDPASAGSVVDLSFSGGSVYGAGYRSGNVWTIGIHVAGPGSVSWTYKDAWGAATPGTCNVQAP
jgi:hypothetical protein